MVAAAGSLGTTLGVASPRTGGAAAAGRCLDELDPENGIEYIGGRAGERSCGVELRNYSARRERVCLGC